MRKRKTIQVTGALALLLVLAGFLAACGDLYEPEVDIRRVNFPDTLEMTEDEFKPLRVTIIKPSVISDSYIVTWKPSDKDVATVEILGADHNDVTITISKTTTVDLLVTAKSPGEASIFVIVENPNGVDITSECIVTVKPKTTTNPDTES
jgi:hypothetical protein